MERATKECVIDYSNESCQINVRLIRVNRRSFILQFFSIDGRAHRLWLRANSVYGPEWNRFIGDYYPNKLQHKYVTNR